MKFPHTREEAHDFIHGKLKNDDVLESNEIEANKLVGFVMFCGSLFIALVWLLCRTGIFHINTDGLSWMTVKVVLELLLPALICRFTRARRKWLKYVLLTELVIVFARVDCTLSYNVVLLMALPAVLSSRYFSVRFTKFITVLTGAAFGISSFANAYWNMGLLDLNFYSPEIGTKLVVKYSLTDAVIRSGVDAAARTKEVMISGYLPKLLIFIILASVCVKIAGKGREMVNQQEQITLNSARIESELSLAKDIQAHMLPNIFPPFPEQNEFDIYATMHPAKEVGGDFYDFYMLDDDNVAMVIADVSGKGVPAALVMVITKTLIKNEVTAGLSPAEAFTKVNHMLCEGNDNNMFVTAWLGVLNSKTGVLTYVNAGHNPPYVKQGTDTFIELKSRPGLVLAGMDGIRYRQYELQLQPGDRIFLYTDGITEAINTDKELYGAARLNDYLNAHANDKLADVLSGVTADIKRFAGAEEQFDDMTMLLLNYIDYKQDLVLDEKTVEAKPENLQIMNDFVEQKLEQAGASAKVTMQVLLCVEEVFTNIASYAYPDSTGNVTFAIGFKDKEMTMRVTDNGEPFDPLQRENPDVTLSAEERQIGGLGIFIVKKTMDNVRYEYKNNGNNLTMKKKIS